MDFQLRVDSYKPSYIIFLFTVMWHSYFNPIVLSGIQPINKIWIKGIEALRGLAFKFLKPWGEATVLI